MGIIIILLIVIICILAPWLAVAVIGLCVGALFLYIAVSLTIVFFQAVCGVLDSVAKNGLPTRTDILVWLRSFKRYRPVYRDGMECFKVRDDANDD